MSAGLALNVTDYKNTQKLTWLAQTDRAQATPTVCVHYDNVITKGVLKPDDDFKDYINYNSMVTISPGHLFRAEVIVYSCAADLVRDVGGPHAEDPEERRHHSTAEAWLLHL